MKKKKKKQELNESILKNAKKQPPETFYKKIGVLKNSAKFTGKHLLFYEVACKFIKKETPTQVFSCEFCGNFKNPF